MLSRKNLTNTVPPAVYQHILAESKDGSIIRRAFSRLARKFGTTRWTVRHIWERAKSSIDSGAFLQISKIGKEKCGRKKKDVTLIQNEIRSIPFLGQRNMRALPRAAGVPRSSLHDLKKNKLILRHSS